MAATSVDETVFLADETVFLAFHKLASQRKLDLASRGLPVPNFLVDEMFDEAQAAGVTESGWEEFIRSRLPSPREEGDEGAEGADADDDDTASRPLKLVASQLAACQRGDDLDVGLLLDAVRALLASLEGLGTFVLLLSKEVMGNIDKVEAAYGEKGRAGRSLRAVLQDEVSSGIHGSGGELCDPSAAMGVLWIGRILRFWEEACMLRATPTPPDFGGGPTPASFQESLDVAYKATLLPYHGWVTQQTFSVAVQTVPEWETVLPKLAPSQQAFQADMEAWVRASPLGRMTAILTELDLVDRRTTA